MEYYFTKRENVDSESGKLVIDDFEFKHLVKVLRKREGDKITVTDGERNIYHCRITAIEKSKLLCDIDSKEFNLYEPEINLTLYLSPLRNASRFEFAVEKAVELGVTSIKPLITEHTLIKNVFSRSRNERMKKIILGAMVQSQRCVLPEFHNTIAFKEMIETEKGKINKFVMYEFSEDVSEIKIDESSNNVSLLIGPEGGFSKNEMDGLRNTGWQVKSLGKRKLRAETAAVVSVFELISGFK